VDLVRFQERVFARAGLGTDRQQPYGFGNRWQLHLYGRTWIDTEAAAALSVAFLETTETASISDYSAFEDQIRHYARQGFVLPWTISAPANKMGRARHLGYDLPVVTGEAKAAWIKGARDPLSTSVFVDVHGAGNDEGIGYWDPIP
jgi:hypothetical protein